MIWTTSKPTKPGLWFYRSDKKADAQVVIVFLSMSGLFMSFWNAASAGRVSDMWGEWSSEPIPEPKEPA